MISDRNFGQQVFWRPFLTCLLLTDVRAWGSARPRLVMLALRHFHRDFHKIFRSKLFVTCRSRCQKGYLQLYTKCTLQIMDTNSLFYLNDGDTHSKDDMKYFPSDVNSTSLSREGGLRLEVSQELSDPLSDGAVQHSSGSDFVFDIAKIVGSVKVKVGEKRLKRKMLQEKVSSLNLCENSSFNLQTLFDEASDDDKRSEKTQNEVKSEIFTTDVSDDDGFGLRVLFEQTENTEKHKTKKARRMQKHHIAKKLSESESFGLELLFDEANEGRRKRRKRKKYEKIQTPECNDITSELDESGKVTVKRKRPNHFIAIRVSSAEIQSAAEKFQMFLLQEDANLKPALIPLPSLHLTMAVMHLDKAMTEVAKGALQKCKVKIMQILKSIHFKIQFVGVGNFRNEVVFVKIEEEKYLECLKSINDVIIATFENEGICMIDEKEWKPHLTLLKLSRKSSLRKKGIRKVNEDSYTSWTNSYFGEELVNNVHLCSMFEPKEQDGFYKCIETISLTEIDEEHAHAGM